MNEILDSILDAVQSVDPVLRTIIAGIAIMLETSILVGLIVPGDSIVIVAGTGVESPLQFIAMYCVVVVGAITGESIGFALGRYFGGHIRRSRLGARIGEHNWQRAERYLAKRGGIAVFLSRFLPVLHSLIPVTVGMSTMRYRRFIAWTVPACLIWTGAYVSVGSAAAETYRELSGRLHFAGIVFVGIIAIFLVIVWAVKKLVNHVEQRHMARSQEEDSASDRSQDGNVTGLTDAPHRNESD